MISAPRQDWNSGDSVNLSDYEPSTLAIVRPHQPSSPSDIWGLWLNCYQLMRPPTSRHMNNSNYKRQLIRDISPVSTEVRFHGIFSLNLNKPCNRIPRYNLQLRERINNCRPTRLGVTGVSYYNKTINAVPHSVECCVSRASATPAVRGQLTEQGL